MATGRLGPLDTHRAAKYQVSGAGHSATHGALRKSVIDGCPAFEPAAMTQTTDMALRVATAPTSNSAELATTNEPQPLPSLSPSVVRHLPSTAFRGGVPTGRPTSFRGRLHQARGKSPFSDGYVCRYYSEEASGNGKTVTRSAVSSPGFNKPIRALGLGGGDTHGKS